MIGHYISTLVLTDPQVALRERPDLRLCFTGPDGRHGTGTAWIGYVNLTAPFRDAAAREYARYHWGYPDNAVRLFDSEIIPWLCEQHIISAIDLINMPAEPRRRYNSILFACSGLSFRHYGVYGSLESVWVVIPPKDYDHDGGNRVTTRRAAE